jgi:hypothetical protein
MVTVLQSSGYESNGYAFDDEVTTGGVINHVHIQPQRNKFGLK